MNFVIYSSLALGAIAAPSQRGGVAEVVPAPAAFVPAVAQSSEFPPSLLPNCAPQECAILTNFSVRNSDNVILCPAPNTAKTPAETFKLFQAGQVKGMTFLMNQPEFKLPGALAYAHVGPLTFPLSYAKDKCLSGYKGTIPKNIIGEFREIGFQIAIP